MNTAHRIVLSFYIQSGYLDQRIDHVKSALKHIVLYFTKKFFYTDLPCINLYNRRDQYPNHHDKNTGNFYWPSMTLIGTGITAYDDTCNEYYQSYNNDCHVKLVLVIQAVKLAAMIGYDHPLPIYFSKHQGKMTAGISNCSC